MKFKIPQLIELPRFNDPRGNLSVIENSKNIPFSIKRTYWIYDVPGGQVRYGHAFRAQEEFIVALSGSFDVTINDGTKETMFHMCRSYYGLYVPKLNWRVIDNFSTNSVALIITDTDYDESDYIYNFQEFQQLRNDNTK